MPAEDLLSAAFTRAHPDDAAAVLERLGADEAASFLAAMRPTEAAAVLGRMGPSSGADCLVRLDGDRAGAMLGALPLDQGAAILRRSGSEPAGRLLAAAPGEAARALRRLLQHPEGTAGALADPRVLTLPDDLPAAQALARIQRAAGQVLYYLYVVDRDGRLRGVINLRELMLAPRRALLGAVMRGEVSRLPARATAPEIVHHPGWRSYHALPVVDDGGRFVGVVRYETLRRLEAAGDSPRSGEEALTTMLTLGELFFVGFARVLESLVTAVAATQAPRPDGRPHAR